MTDAPCSKTRSSIERLAAWSLSDDPDLLSNLSRRQARLLLLDSVGCALAALATGEIAGIVDLATELGGSPQCTILGTAKRVDAQNAILANGGLLRVLDLNDIVYSYFRGKLVVAGHPSDNIAVALAIGEKNDRGISDVCDAIIVGYELYGRLRALMPYPSPFDGTSISGLVAAVMSARLLGLDEGTTAHALALAAARSITPGIVRKGHLSAAKSLTNALIAQSGVLAARLAETGATGPLEILDDKEVGLPIMFRPNGDSSTLYAPQREKPKILSSHVKTYPCIGTGQTAVRAALEALQEVGADPTAIERIDVVMADVPFVRNQQNDMSRRYPHSREAADHSFTFLPAVALIDGELTFRQFENDRWHDPSTQALMEKVNLSVAEDLNSRAPDSMPCRIKVTLESGREVTRECLYPPGHSSASGLDSDVVKAKFRAFTKPALSEESCENVIRFALEADSSQPIRKLMHLVGGG
jgi:2-methylcitrate dehydratase